RFLAHGVDTGDVAAGPVEAGHKAKRDRVAATAENDRNCRSRGFGSKRRFRNTGADHDRDTAADQIGCQDRQPFRFVIRPPVFDLHVAALEETNLVEPLAECRQPRCARLRTTRVEISDHRHPLLRPCRERPRDRRATEQRDECAAPHSITSSASVSRLSEIFRPSVFAVLKLITSSNLLANMIGRSPGLVPLRIRAAYSPTCRWTSTMSMP